MEPEIKKVKTDSEFPKPNGNDNFMGPQQQSQNDGEAEPKDSSRLMQQSISSGKIYMDYNATTPLESSVLDAIHVALRDAWGNPSSSYEEGRLAKTVIEESRINVAEMINGQKHEIIFMSGGTEANNAVFDTVIQEYADLRRSSPFNFINKENNLDQSYSGSESFPDVPHIITSNVEHDSVSLTAKCLNDIGKIQATFVPVSPVTGCLTVKDVIASIKRNTAMVTVMLANNETGIIQPVAEISDAIKLLNIKREENGLPKILIHTDAAQAIGKIKVDVKVLGVDYLTIVGHKFYAPRIGALWVRNLGHQQSAPLHPLFYGGRQERHFRPGTENTGMIAGLGEAAKLVKVNIEKYENHMEKVRNFLEVSLEQGFGDQVHLNSKKMVSSDQTIKRLPNTCNLSFIGKNLEGYKILKHVKYLQASVGAACHSDKETKPSHILLACGINEDIARNALRLSVGRNTTRGDVTLVIDDLLRTVNMLKGGSKS